MVAGARLALEAGWEVRGSDTPLYPPASEMAALLGVPIASSYRADNLAWGPDVVIIGNALSRGNPEVEAALDRGLHYMSLPEWLKDVVLRRRRPVVITGTHGKTTTTALTAFVLDRVGFTPGFLIGGQPIDFAHSARLGPEGAPFVIEGDEYDTAFFDKRAKFFHYLPEIAVVTSVEFDHGDIYRGFAEIERAFQLMLCQIPKHGYLVVCLDDPGAAALISHARCQVATYGFHEQAQWRGVWNGAQNGRALLDVYSPGNAGPPPGPWAKLEVPLAGRHNLQNTLAAVTVAALLGADPAAIGKAVYAFQSVRRRFEIFLETRGMTFIDDFAHHPTAVRETIRAAQNRWPGRRLVAVFEPRSNTTVTNRFQDELAAAFSEADIVWLGPIHRAETIPAETRLDRSALVKRLTAQNVEAHAADNVDPIVESILQNGRPNDIVLIMSNGSFNGIYDKFRGR